MSTKLGPVDLSESAAGEEDPGSSIDVPNRYTSAMPSSPPPRNAIEAVTHADPYTYYAQLRRERPFYFDDGLGLWVASSLQAVEAALHHADLLVRPPAELVPRALVGTPAGEVFACLVRMNDGDFHATHQPAVREAARRFTMADVAQAAAEAARDLAPRVDTNALLSALPVQAVARLLGIDAAQLDRTVGWVIDFVQGIGPQASQDVISRANEAAGQLMLQGDAQGMDRVKAANRIAFMQQSLDATAGLVGNSVLLSRSRPELLGDGAPLAAWRGLVAEVARWDAPVQNTRRFAPADMELEGRAIAKGQGVLVVLASANRDVALNPDPDAFDTARKDRRMMTFGSGVHACPGDAIAIEIAASALHTLQADGHLKLMFGQHTGYRPLANARIPVFGAQGE